MLEELKAGGVYMKMKHPPSAKPENMEAIQSQLDKKSDPQSL